MTGWRQKVREIRESLFVASPVIVREVYPEKQRVDIQLKTKKQKLDPPLILDVPVSHQESKTFSERQLPEPDDVAWVVFTNKALDKVMQDTTISTPDYDRVLDINDCFLAGGWSTEQEGIPKEIGAMKPEDWLIGIHRDTNSRMYLRSNGDIVLHPSTGKRIELVENAKYSVPLFELLQVIYDTHTHPTAVGPSGPPTPQLTSNQGSQRVKVDN